MKSRRITMIMNLAASREKFSPWYKTQDRGGGVIWGGGGITSFRTLPGVSYVSTCHRTSHIIPYLSMMAKKKVLITQSYSNSEKQAKF